MRGWRGATWKGHRALAVPSLAMLVNVRTRPPVPGPSFLKEEEVALPVPPGQLPVHVLVGMTRPSTTDDGWWLAVLFAHDEAGVVEAGHERPGGQRIAARVERGLGRVRLTGCVGRTDRPGG